MLKNTNPKENEMTTYRFAGLPSNASVAAGVTLLTSAWLFVAAGAIIVAEGPSAPPARPAVPAASAAPSTPAPAWASAPQAPAEAEAEPVIPPQARLKIVVEARRA